MFPLGDRNTESVILISPDTTIAPPAWPETANQIRDYENRDWKHSL